MQRQSLSLPPTPQFNICKFLHVLVGYIKQNHGTVLATFDDGYLTQLIYLRTHLWCVDMGEWAVHSSGG